VKVLTLAASWEEEEEPMRLIKEQRTTPHDLGEYRAGTSAVIAGLRGSWDSDVSYLTKLAGGNLWREK
jgi:hypothetical protein